MFVIHLKCRVMNVTARFRYRVALTTAMSSGINKLRTLIDFYIEGRTSLQKDVVLEMNSQDETVLSKDCDSNKRPIRIAPFLAAVMQLANQLVCD